MLITYVNTCSIIHAKAMLATLTFKHRNNVKTTKKSFEKGEEFRYLGTTLTNQNSIREEIRRRLKLGNACYHSVQNILSSGLLFKKIKIKIYRTAHFPVALYGCEIWSLSGTKHSVKQRHVSRSMNASSTPLRKPKTPNSEKKKVKFYML
jgi:hypothetical protein